MQRRKTRCFIVFAHPKLSCYLPHLCILRTLEIVTLSVAHKKRAQIRSELSAELQFQIQWSDGERCHLGALGSIEEVCRSRGLHQGVLGYWVETSNWGVNPTVNLVLLASFVHLKKS
jgi:hypothetical protein